MAVMTFAAIDIGSYEVSMKIFEMSKRIGFRELNDVRYSLEIGKGVYSDGKIDSEMLNVLCEVLNDFKRLMQDFGVEEYRACGTSAFRELVNPLLIIEQIYQRTGMKIEILSPFASCISVFVASLTCDTLPGAEPTSSLYIV